MLFMLSLFFQDSKVKKLIFKSLLFSVAHSLSLFLAVFFQLGTSYFIEPLIALSILFSSLGILFKLTYARLDIFFILVFGVIHGLGFANAFIEFGDGSLMASIPSFNLGVEFAQISILSACYVLFEFGLSRFSFYKRYIVYPILSVISCVAIYWFWIRI